MKRLAECMRCSAVVSFLLLTACARDPVQPFEPFTCRSGNPCSLEPVQVAGGYFYGSLSVGGEHTCALELSGEAYCWGSNRSGQSGNSSVASFSSTPVAVVGGLLFTKITAGAFHTCALTAQGEAYCWGNGASGALGTGVLPDICGAAECSRSPIQVIGGHNFTSIEAGFSHTCAVTVTNSAYCWGSNSHGELGTGGFYEGSSLPEAVTGNQQFMAISAGADFTCALAADHKAWCWGSGAADALGSVPQEACPSGMQQVPCASSPAPVETAVTFVKLVAGDLHTCGLTTDGYVYCWGENEYGQIGVPGAPRGHIPLQVAFADGTRITALSVAREHSCALSLSFVPYCWGRNTSGEVGAGVNDVHFRSPIAVAGTRSYGTIAAGGTFLSSHTCALTSVGEAYCWGSRELGQLGDGR